MTRLLPLAVLAVAGACARGSEQVSIDYRAFVEPGPTVTARPLGPARATGLTSAAIEDLPQRKVFLGSGQGAAAEARAAARANQEAAYAQAVQELRQLYRAEASSGQRRLREELLVKSEKDFEALYADIRGLFERHADRVGPKWTRLATVAGFPDPPVKSRRPPPAIDVVAAAEFKEAARLRDEINSLDAAYRRDIGSRFEELRQQFRARSSELAAAGILALDSADQRAEAEARQLADRLIKDLEESMVADFERLESVPGRAVAVKGPPYRSPQFPDPADPAWTESDRLLRQAELFARLKGYRLVAPGSRVRDVTEEFKEWKRRPAGR